MPNIQPKHIPVVREVGALPAQSDVATVRPLKDHVLVKLEERPTHHGLIELPKNLDPRNQGMRTATVVACGPGTDKVPMTVCVGDRVLVGRDPGWELPDGHRMMRVGAIEMVLEATAEVG